MKRGRVRIPLDDPSPIEGGVRSVVLAIVRSLVTSALLVAAYVLLPLRVIGIAPILFFAIGAALFGVSLALQLRQIAASRQPGLQAIQAVGLLLGLIVIVFASVYLLASTADPRAFNVPLDRVSALYFAVTTLSTVGFGDIVAVTDSARILVTIQMLVDLVLVASVIRLVVGAIGRARAEPKEPPS